MRAARLQFTVRSAEEVEQRGGGDVWLRRALGAEVAARIKIVVRELYDDDSVAQPERLMLCNADGTPKHERWFWLTEAGQLLWGKNRDGSNHVLWKQLNFSAPRKQRTVVGVEDQWLALHTAPCTISTAEGQPVVVRLPHRVRDKWLRVLRAVGAAHELFGAGLPGAAVRSLAAAGCRGVRDLLGVDASSLECAAAATVAAAKEKLDALDGRLCAAAEEGDAAAIERLVAEGASPDAKNEHGIPAVYSAAARGHAGAVSALARLGADLDARGDRGWTALMNAAQWGRVECARALLAGGADRTVRATAGCWKGKTALEIAEAEREAEVAALLRRE